MAKYVILILLSALIFSFAGCTPKLKEFKVEKCNFSIGTYSEPINQVIPLPRQAGRDLVMDIFTTRVDKKKYIFGCIRHAKGLNLPRRAKNFPWRSYMKRAYGETDVSIKKKKIQGRQATRIFFLELSGYTDLISVRGVSFPSRKQIIYAYTVHTTEKSTKPIDLAEAFLDSIKLGVD